MKEKRIFNIVDLVFNALVIIFTIGSVAYYWFKVGTGNMQVVGSTCFRFFTIDSNILCAITCAIMLVFNIRRLKDNNLVTPQWAVIAKFLGMNSVMVTFLVVVVGLTPMNVFMNGKPLFDLYTENSFFLHFLCPVMAFISVVIFEKWDNFDKKYMWLELCAVIVYGLVYFPLVLTGVWPDFYGFTAGGRWYLMWIAPVGIGAITIGIGYLTFFLKDKARAKEFIKD